MYCNNSKIKESQVEPRWFCPYCKKIKKRSRRFPSVKALSWHIGHLHKTDAKYVDLPIEQVQETVARAAKAFELGILRP